MTCRRALILFLLLAPSLLVASQTTLTVPLTSDDLAKIEASTERRYQVGVVKAAGVALDVAAVRPEDFAGGPKLLAFGKIQKTADGFAWTASIESPGAAALRVHFSELFLPRNATLTISNNLGQAFAYTGSGPDGTGEFWSNTLAGSSVDLRVDYRGNDVGHVLQALRFVVPEIGPLSGRFPTADAQAGSELCAYNAPCIVNAMCGSTNSAVTTAKKAVAMILFISGPFQYVCSGGLIADSDPLSAIPYFMTANHCLHTSGEASTVEAYFDYTTPCGSCDDTFSDEPRTLGSSVVSSNKSSDYTLLRLSQPAPAGTAFLTWSNVPIANTNGVNLYRISHPAAAPQAYSEHRVDTSRTTCRSWPRGGWIYSSDVFGGTEGGSSGSPVVNAAGQFVGQLSGACGFNVNDACDDVQNATVDGAFAAYYNNVAQYLGPGSACTDADGDGYCVTEGDCNDNNAAVNPGAAEICSDGIDNDCDGLIDSADPTCQTGGCDLLPKGSSCSADSQCCSGNCKGKPGAKTCK